MGPRSRRLVGADPNVPKGNIPLFQVSLDLRKDPPAHLDLARELKPLREKGVRVIGSGNLVHNLMALSPGAAPYDWASAFDATRKERIEARDAAGVGASLSGRSARLAHPTPEHFLPLLFPLGVADENDELGFFNKSFDMASISMRSFLLS